jgi:drug/metabolite transporter (DMT)-like permease
VLRLFQIIFKSSPFIRYDASMALSSRSTASALLLIAPFFFWGTAMVAMKGSLGHTTPLFLAAVRLLPAGLLILAVAWAMGKPQPQGWRSWAWIVAFAAIDATLFQTLLAEGLQRTGAGLGSVMIDSQPLAVALLASWLFGEQIGLWGWLGMAFGIGGISLLGLPDAWILLAGQALGELVRLPFSEQSRSESLAELIALLPSDNWLRALFHNGEWLMLLAALSMAVGMILSRYVSRQVDPIVATGWHMVLGGLPVALLSWQWEPDALVGLTLSDWLALGYASVFGSAIAYGLFFYFAARGSLTSLSALTFLTPVFALLFGSLFLQEMLSEVQMVGVGLTLVSIYLINQREAIAQRFSPVAPASPGLAEDLGELLDPDPAVRAPKL